MANFAVRRNCRAVFFESRLHGLPHLEAAVKFFFIRIR
jgi:hypothetical protein